MQGAAPLISARPGPKPRIVTFTVGQAAPDRGCSWSLQAEMACATAILHAKKTCSASAARC